MLAACVRAGRRAGLQGCLHPMACLPITPIRLLARSPACLPACLQISEYLQGRLAAATETGDGAGSSAAGAAGAEQQQAALETLLQLSALSEAELRALMEQQGVEAEQQAQVLEGLVAARDARPLSCHLPAALAAKVGPLPEDLPNRAAPAGGAADAIGGAARLSQQLRHLFFQSSEFAAVQVRACVARAPAVAGGKRIARTICAFLSAPGSPAAVTTCTSSPFAPETSNMRAHCPSAHPAAGLPHPEFSAGAGCCGGYNVGPDAAGQQEARVPGGAGSLRLHACAGTGAAWQGWLGTLHVARTAMGTRVVV